MFVVTISYTAPLAQIDELMPAHRDWLSQGYDSGLLLASGPQTPRTGGVVLARAVSREELDAALAEDPFNKAGAATYRRSTLGPWREPVSTTPCIAWIPRSPSAALDSSGSFRSW